MSEKIKVGVVGLGAMGQHHVRIYSSMKDADLIGISDTDEKKMEKLASRYKTKAFKDYRELLKMGLDAINIAVPTSLHEQVALDAAEFGCHIFVEKPISNSIEGAKRIIDATRTNSLKLMVGHIERFNPVVSTIKKTLNIDDTLLLGIMRVGPFPPRIKDVGVVVDIGVHDIDIIRYITQSEFKSVKSSITKNFGDKEDAAILSFKMENGILAYIINDWLTPFKIREIKIATKDIFIVGDLFNQKLTEYSKYQMDGSFKTKDLSVQYSEPLKLELESFINCIKNDAPPPVTGEDGLIALEIALQCLKQ